MWGEIEKSIVQEVLVVLVEIRKLVLDLGIAPFVGYSYLSWSLYISHANNEEGGSEQDNRIEESD